MKILLFGATGMMGTAIDFICNTKKINCIGISHKEVEITERKAVYEQIEKHAPEIVINCAAIIGTNTCESTPAYTFNVNSVAVSYMAKCCEQRKIVFVQPSSHAVFDGTKDGFYDEHDKPNPISIYSVSKYTAECIAMNQCAKHYIIRFPTMFGERRNHALGFVDKIIEKLVKREELKIADDKIDSMTYALDAADRLIWILKQELPYGIYHLANSGSVSYFDFVKKITEKLNIDCQLTRAKDADFSSLGYKPLRTAMSSAKLKPMRPWEDALSDYIDNSLRRRFL